MPATSRDTWRHVARATAAHSTVIFNDTSSCRFLTSESLRPMLGAPILSGPTEVPVMRQPRDGGVILRLSHDGYASRFGVVHQRSLRLSPDGRRLDGEDVFAPAHGESLPAKRGDAFAVRFHLHPTVKANRLTDGHGVMLVLPNREVWTFDAYEERVDIEESVYLAGPDGPRRTVQIVIHGHAREVPRVHWTFAHRDANEPTARRATREEPELPL
jgi:uncharacterized heparinase superfamily protein